MSKYDILRALDFNAVHSGDAIARQHFELAAIAIRDAQTEAGYWRRRATAEQSRAREHRREADTLAGLLQRLLDAEDSPTQEGTGDVG